MFESHIKPLIDHILFASCLVILFSCIVLSFKTRFVQLRLFSTMGRNLFGFLLKKEKTNAVVPHKALFTAMSTTMGISAIVAPVIAIRLGGPGALVGFFLTTLLGSAATFVEVTLSMHYRKSLSNGIVMGGPMQYLEKGLSPFLAKVYAVCCLLLMTAWSGTQANQLAAIFSSPLLGAYKVPTILSGSLIALIVTIILFGGIRRISSISAKIVPTMFCLYVGACLWILLINADRLLEVFNLIIDSAISPKSLASGAIAGGLVQSLRWGVFKGIQGNEAGIGTQTIPHSMAEATTPLSQGVLSMASTYTAGLISILSGIVAILTDTWQSPHIPLGINMLVESFRIHFSEIGVAIVSITTFLFAFGTIIGNSYNGSECFNYLSKNRYTKGYFLFMAAMVLFGAIAEVSTFWALIDIVLALVAVPHVVSLLFLAYRKPELLKI